MKQLLLLAIGFALVSCQSGSGKSDAESIEKISQVFDAHGGYDTWSQMQTLRFAMDEEVHLVSLKDRKILIKEGKKKIGFDGEKVWVTPDDADASDAHFYHNLFFYFIGMPFVLGDPGVIYELIPSKQILGKSYDGIKVSYGDGVGNSSEDNYILWVDPETNKMEWLMYTVTYRSGEESDQYKLIKYSQWLERKGLLLPQRLEWYTYKNDSVGNVRSEVTFSSVKLSKDRTSEVLFQMPENAQLAPLNSQ